MPRIHVRVWSSEKPKRWVNRNSACVSGYVLGSLTESSRNDSSISYLARISPVDALARTETSPAPAPDREAKDVDDTAANSAAMSVDYTYAAVAASSALAVFGGFKSCTNVRTLAGSARRAAP